MYPVIKKRHVLAWVYESSQNPDFRDLTNPKVETHAFCPHDLLSLLNLSALQCLSWQKGMGIKQALGKD